MPRHFVDNCCQLFDGVRYKHIDRFSCCTKIFLREESGVLRRKLIVVVLCAYIFKNVCLSPITPDIRQHAYGWSNIVPSFRYAHRL